MNQAEQLIETGDLPDATRGIALMGKGKGMLEVAEILLKESGFGEPRVSELSSEVN